jgi:hypothetical protein
MNHSNIPTLDIVGFTVAVDKEINLLMDVFFEKVEEYWSKHCTPLKIDDEIKKHVIVISYGDPLFNNSEDNNQEPFFRHTTNDHEILEDKLRFKNVLLGLLYVKEFKPIFKDLAMSLYKEVKEYVAGNNK